LACQDEFSVKNSLDVIEIYEHTLDFVLHLSRLFRSVLSRACHSNTRVRLKLFSPKACLIISKGPRRNFSEICTKFDAVLLWDPTRNLIRPDTRL
jgi:hypothetical protein